MCGVVCDYVAVCADVCGVCAAVVHDAGVCDVVDCVGCVFVGVCVCGYVR